VPCGEAARRALAAGGVKVTPVTLEQDVKGALTKVRLGEVDAALVYRTDVRSARGTVSGVDFPESAGAVNDYPIVSLAGAPNSAVGRAFVRLVVSSEGRRTLLGAGFLAP
jgi:molybdate transport system substrate-binding protein